MFSLTPSPFVSRHLLAGKITLSAALLFTGLAATSRAEVINHEWIAGNGAWETKANWSPQPAATIGLSTSAFDRVTIDGNVTVNRTGSLIFSGLGTDGLKAGTFTALTLTGGATLNVSTSFRVSSASGSPNTAVRNVLIDTGSSLIVGTSITTGMQNSSANNSTWTVKGSVTAASFLGQKTTSATFSGGFILNIDGGSFTIADTFDWGTPTTVTNLSTFGRITLSNSGSFAVGSIANWATSTSDNNYVNFADESGIFAIDNTTISLLEIQGLIADGYIRKGTGVTGDFDIFNTGEVWQISIAPIPEPSTYALVAFGAGAAILRRRKSAAYGKRHPRCL